MAGKSSSPFTNQVQRHRILQEGLDGLKRLGYKGRRNLLDENCAIIIAHLEVQLPGTLEEAQARNEEITGIRRSLPQIQAFLKKHLLRRKVKQAPEKADIDTQEQFRHHRLSEQDAHGLSR